MSEYLTQSRPYAEAIFEISEQDNSTDSWIKAVSYTHLTLPTIE